MTAFYCSRCRARLTPDLVELPAIPEVSCDDEDRDPETRRAPSTLPRGHYAIEPEPWGAPYVPHPDQESVEVAQPRGLMTCVDGVLVVSAGQRNNIVIHPLDAAGLQPLPNGENSIGCCGPAGNSGLNRACACGAPVATLAADCYGPYELHLDPLHVDALDPGTSDA